MFLQQRIRWRVLGVDFAQIFFYPATSLQVVHCAILLMGSGYVHTFKTSVVFEDFQAAVAHKRLEGVDVHASGIFTLSIGLSGNSSSYTAKLKKARIDRAAA
ncbi:MAG: hypothetical protein KF893_04700 [Caldilineaceae bacterium]|nr:hypothetical protein [Caldilineaceae bacterium]